MQKKICFWVIFFPPKKMVIFERFFYFLRPAFSHGRRATRSPWSIPESFDNVCEKQDTLLQMPVPILGKLKAELVGRLGGWVCGCGPVLLD